MAKSAKFERLEEIWNVKTDNTIPTLLFSKQIKNGNSRIQGKYNSNFQTVDQCHVNLVTASHK